MPCYPFIFPLFLLVFFLTLQLPFFQLFSSLFLLFFSPLFLTLPLQFLQPFIFLFDYSFPHLLYVLTYHYSFSNPSPPFLAIFLPIIPHLTLQFLQPFLYPFYSSSPHLFSYIFGITSSTPPSSIQSMFAYKKKVITLISFNGFFFSKLFPATLLLFLIALLWVDAIWYFGFVFLNSPNHLFFLPLLWLCLIENY